MPIFFVHMDDDYVFFVLFLSSDKFIEFGDDFLLVEDIHG
ncbi:hypothetical protein DSUL_150093 [Desulfovibrionales bacterium]